jgi:hypothetical protein
MEGPPRYTISAHEDQFSPPRPNGRCRLGDATFAGMGSKEEHAPIPAVRAAPIEPLRSTETLPFAGT